MPMLTCYLFPAFVWEGGGGKEKRKEYSKKYIYITLSHFVYGEIIFSSQENVKSFLFLNIHSRHFNWIFSQNSQRSSLKYFHYSK